jgi:hypothetical protein
MSKNIGEVNISSQIQKHKNGQFEFENKIKSTEINAVFFKKI